MEIACVLNGLQNHGKGPSQMACVCETKWLGFNQDMASNANLFLGCCWATNCFIKVNWRVCLNSGSMMSEYHSLWHVYLVYSGMKKLSYYQKKRMLFKKVVQLLRSRYGKKLIEQISLQTKLHLAFFHVNMH